MKNKLEKLFAIISTVITYLLTFTCYSIMLLIMFGLYEPTVKLVTVMLFLVAAKIFEQQLKK